MEDLPQRVGVGPTLKKSACGRRAERVCESRRGSAWGWVPTRNYY